MSISLLVATGISLFAFVGAMLLLMRYRNWRNGFFAAATAVMAALLLGRYSSTLINSDWEWSYATGYSDITAVALSALALIAVVFLERLINRQIKDEQAFELPRYSVDHAAIAALWIERSGKIVDANAWSAECLNYDKTELLTRHVFDIDTSLNKGLWATHWQRLKRGGSLSYETQYLSKDGAQLSVDVTATYLEFDGKEYCFAFAQDITDRKRQEYALEYQASHDALTDLANRETFARRLTEELDKAARAEQEVAVFLLDLDRFKEVNDTLGHSVGDRLLQELSVRLAAHLPPHVTFARFGGDEFALLMPNLRCVHDAQTFANSLIEKIRQPFLLDEITLDVGGSIGAAIFPEHGKTPEELLQHADIAMYTAKRQHTGYELYCPENDPHSVRNLTLAGDLRRAIEGGDLELAFQPKIDIQAGKVVGAEALARWKRPGQGYVSPEEFITHAEQCGLILPLTEWVLNAAIERAAGWHAAGHPIDIAVNLSARLLHHGAIIQTVTSILRKWNFPSHCLTMEVTENALLADPAHAMKVIEQFAELGVKISIDDFGKGYSSLAYLKTLAARELKIDKSFVLGMDSNASDRTIVKSVIALAHDLGLKVVAEGMETMTALEVLVDFQCDLGQGYLFRKPMSGSDFEHWLDPDKWGRPAAADAEAAPAKMPEIARIAA